MSVADAVNELLCSSSSSSSSSSSVSLVCLSQLKFGSAEQTDEALTWSHPHKHRFIILKLVSLSLCVQIERGVNCGICTEWGRTMSRTLRIYQIWQFLQNASCRWWSWNCFSESVFITRKFFPLLMNSCLNWKDGTSAAHQWISSAFFFSTIPLYSQDFYFYINFNKSSWFWLTRNISTLLAIQLYSWKRRLTLFSTCKSKQKRPPLISLPVLGPNDLLWCEVSMFLTCEQTNTLFPITCSKTLSSLRSKTGLKQDNSWKITDTQAAVVSSGWNSGDMVY